MDSRRGRSLCVVLCSVVALTLVVAAIYNNSNDNSLVSSVFGTNALYVGTEYSVPSKEIEIPHVESNPVPSDSVLHSLSTAQLSDLYHGYTASTQALCSRVLRMGFVGDGGWDLCDDPQYKPDQANCLVYSMGINYDWSYDDAIEKYGCEVHSYDPSMSKEKDHLRGTKVHFHKVGISGKDENVERKPGKWAVFTLASLRRINGHTADKRRLDAVKMDVEGAEFPALEKAVTDGSLSDVRQLSFEIHISPSGGDPNRAKVIKMMKILRGLWNLGFRIYFTTRNSSKVNLYTSKSHGVQRTACIEINMVNVRHRRPAGQY